MAATRSKDAQSNSGSANTAGTATAEDKRSKNTDDSKPANAEGKENAAAGQPLGPPPRPNHNGDYFNQNHNTNNNPSYTTEPNPFEEQFGNPSSETPGKLGLPPLASLTSPSSLMPNDTPGWNSLRAGPLSPAMLTGPTGGDYFDPAYARGFPTPNESSMRTGLTPGGGGSMFPAPSPGTAAMFNSLGMNTPGTLDFLKSGINSRPSANGAAPTSQPSESQTTQGLELKLPAAQANATYDASGHTADADAAANGLFMLAQSNGARQQNGFQNNQSPQVTTSIAGSSVLAEAERNGKTSIGSSSTQVDDDLSDSDMSEEPPKPTTRSRGRKAAETKSTPNNRRKATDTPAKTPSSKRARHSIAHEKMEEEESPEPDISPKDGRKMTDEEKRKNFLERNRIAALKCRQRKKQWLANLQSKCDLYSQENDALTHTVNQLREQVFTLKQLLISHKDCPVTIQQNLNPQAFNQLLNQDVGMVGYIPTTNGAVQPMSMMMPDGRQVQNAGQVLPRT